MDLHTATNDPAPLSDAMDAYRISTTCGADSIFGQDMQTAIILQLWKHMVKQLLYCHVWQLSTVTRLGARQTALSRSGGLAGAAASCAIREGKLEKAVEFLETGRTVFWSQALRLRTLDELDRKAPALAGRLRLISSELEKGSFRVPFIGDDTPWKISIVEQDATRLRHLNRDWNDVVKEVRKLGGFEHFLHLLPSQH